MTLSSEQHVNSLAWQAPNPFQPNLLLCFFHVSHLDYTPYPPSVSWAVLLLQLGLCYFLSLSFQKLLMFVKTLELLRGSSSQSCHLRPPQWQSLLPTVTCTVARTLWTPVPLGACCFTWEEPGCVHHTPTWSWSLRRKRLARPQNENSYQSLGARHNRILSWKCTGCSVLLPWAFPLWEHPQRLDVGLELISLVLKITIMDVIAFQRTAFVTRGHWCLALAHPHLCSQDSTEFIL